MYRKGKAASPLPTMAKVNIFPSFVQTISFFDLNKGT
jgi:hypothetical protein